MPGATKDPRYSIARTISKALKRRATLYVTGPMIVEGKSRVDVTMGGRLYRVTVEEVAEEKRERTWAGPGELELSGYLDASD